jgi:hypothetical protein
VLDARKILELNDGTPGAGKWLYQNKINLFAKLTANAMQRLFLLAVSAVLFLCAGCESASVFAPSNPMFQTWVFERYDSLAQARVYVTSTNSVAFQRRGGLVFKSDGAFEGYFPSNFTSIQFIGTWQWQSRNTFIIGSMRYLSCSTCALYAPPWFGYDTLTIEVTPSTLTTRRYTK